MFLDSTKGVFEMTQATQAAQVAVPDGAPKQEPEKERFYLEVPKTLWHLNPTVEYLKSDERFLDTSYAASLVLIHAQRGVVPEVLLVRQNPNDAEKFLQLSGGPRTRPDSWKMPIGRFYPFRYLDEKKNPIYDHHLWDTVIEEFREETGIDFRYAGNSDEESDQILQSLMRSPVVEYRKWSKRPPNRYHIDRVHFFVTSHVFVPDPKVYQKAIELTEVKSFPLHELPRMDLNGDGATMLFSHVCRLVEFFELFENEQFCEQFPRGEWERIKYFKLINGIPDDIGETIRKRFPDYNIPSFQY